MEGRHGPDAGFAAEIDPTKGTFTQRAARNIAERHLDRYFEQVEAELNHREQQWLSR